MAQVEKRKASTEEEDNKRIKIYGDPKYKFNQDNDTLSHTASFLTLKEKHNVKGVSKQFHRVTSDVIDDPHISIVLEEKTFYETYDKLNRGILTGFNQYGELIEKHVSGNAFDLVTMITLKSIPIEDKIVSTLPLFQSKFKNIERIQIYDDEGVQVWWYTHRKNILDSSNRIVEWMSPTFKHYAPSMFENCSMLLFKKIRIEDSSALVSTKHGIQLKKISKKV
jgi:hypothetical protein